MSNTVTQMRNVNSATKPMAYVSCYARSEIFAPNRWEDVLYVGGIFALPLLSGVLQSSGRFGLVAFPLVFAMADLGLRSERVHRAYIVYAGEILTEGNPDEIVNDPDVRRLYLGEEFRL